MDRFPILQLTSSMTLENSTNDKVVWVDKKRKEVKFATTRVWKDFREDQPKLKWHSSVWYSQCIPKHSFVVWLAIHERLTTQDRLAQWYPGNR